MSARTTSRLRFGAAQRLLVVVLLAGSLLAQQVPSQAEPVGAVRDFDTSSDMVYGGQEPQVAVNPKDHDNIVVFRHGGGVFANTSGGRTPNPQALPSEADPFKHPSAGLQVWMLAHCTVAVTFDGGRTWQDIDPPLYDAFYSGCGDPTVLALPDGTFVILGMMMSSAGSVQVQRSSRSYDGGRTWTTPSTVYSKAQAVSKLLDGEIVSLFGVPDNDRPWLEADASTGVVYDSFVARIDPNGSTRGRRYVSHTKSGDKWQGPYPLDDAEHPGGGSGTIVAGKGVLTATYTASAAPGRTCPCTVFQQSTDHGRTWRRTILPTDEGTFVLGGFVAGDPARRGRFAIAALDEAGTALRVARTEDAGRSWRTSMVRGSKGAEMNRPWISYAPSNGALGVFWREFDADGGQNAFAAVSRDNGARWSAPRRLNSETAPPRYHGLHVFDDLSHVTLTDTHLYAAWADMRGPEGNTVTQAWLGRWRYAAN
jgi:hypothetical protein